MYENRRCQHFELESEVRIQLIVNYFKTFRDRLALKLFYGHGVI